MDHLAAFCGVAPRANCSKFHLLLGEIVKKISSSQINFRRIFQEPTFVIQTLNCEQVSLRNLRDALQILNNLNIGRLIIENAGLTCLVIAERSTKEALLFQRAHTEHGTLEQVIGHGKFALEHTFHLFVSLGNE